MGEEPVQVGNGVDARADPIEQQPDLGRTGRVGLAGDAGGLHAYHAHEQGQAVGDAMMGLRRGILRREALEFGLSEGGVHDGPPFASNYAPVMAPRK